MKTITFLENLALHTHYQKSTAELINAQPQHIQQAFVDSNSAQIRALFPCTDTLANSSHVVAANFH